MGFDLKDALWKARKGNLPPPTVLDIQALNQLPLTSTFRHQVQQIINQLQSNSEMAIQSLPQLENWFTQLNSHTVLPFPFSWDEPLMLQLLELLSQLQLIIYDQTFSQQGELQQQIIGSQQQQQQQQQSNNNENSPYVSQFFLSDEEQESHQHYWENSSYYPSQYYFDEDDEIELHFTQSARNSSRRVTFGPVSVFGGDDDDNNANSDDDSDDPDENQDNQNNQEEEKHPLTPTTQTGGRNTDRSFSSERNPSNRSNEERKVVKFAEDCYNSKQSNPVKKKHLHHYYHNQEEQDLRNQEFEELQFQQEIENEDQRLGLMFDNIFGQNNLSH